MKKNALVLVLKNSVAGCKRCLQALKVVLLTRSDLPSEQRAVPACEDRCAKATLLAGGAFCTVLAFFLSWFRLQCGPRKETNGDSMGPGSRCVLAL